MGAALVLRDAHLRWRCGGLLRMRAEAARSNLKRLHTQSSSFETPRCAWLLRMRFQPTCPQSFEPHSVLILRSARRARLEGWGHSQSDFAARFDNARSASK